MAQERFEESLALVRGLRDVEAHKRPEMEADAFEAIGKGLIAMKRTPEIMDSVDKALIIDILTLIAKRGLEKKLLKARAVSSMSIVLDRPPWRQVALAQPELLDRLKELLASSPSLEKLDAAYEGTPKGDDCIDVKPDTTPKTPFGTKLHEGVMAMRDFDYVFPTDPIGTKLDTASEGFQKFYEGVAKLGSSTGRGEVSGEGEACLAEYDDQWPNILQFIFGMYEHRARRTWHAKIKFVIGTLVKLSPRFKSAMEGRESIPIESFKSMSSSEQAKREFKPAVNLDDQAESPKSMATTRSGEVAFLSLKERAEVPKPGVVWVDFRDQAYLSSSLQLEDSIDFVGFHDDADAADFAPAEMWLDYVMGRAGDPKTRVAVLIVNNRHMDTVQQIRDFCAQEGYEPPRVIVCTRQPPSEFAKWGIEIENVTPKWEVAAELAMIHVKLETIFMDPGSTSSANLGSSSSTRIPGKWRYDDVSFIAKSNPFRCTGKDSLQELCEHITEHAASDRPLYVELNPLHRARSSRTFPDKCGAIEWLTGQAQSDQS